MNPYYNAMDRCTPPEGMEERLAQNVLSALPGRAGAFKPRGFRRKGAALLLAAVLLLGTGATTIWDPLFVRRFGPQAAMSALGGAVFQKLDLTSVCDDVALTIPQALCSDKSIHYILEYRLPEGFSLEEGEYLTYPDEVRYYGTGDYTWEDLKALEGEAWNSCDWSDFSDIHDYFSRREEFVLAPCDMILVNKGGTGQGSGNGSTKGYDPDANTVTWLFSRDFDTGWSLNEQPLTILVTPPCVKHADGTETAVTDHPAIITFRPAYDGPQALSGLFEEGGVKITATLSTFSLSLEAEGMGYPCYEDMVKDTRLVAKDGQEKAVSLMGFTNGGSGFGPEGQPLEVSTTVHFLLLTDISEFTALRMGDYEIPLS